VPLTTLQCTEKVLPFYYLWLQIYLMLKVTQNRINSSLQRWPWIARLISFVIFFSLNAFLKCKVPNSLSLWILLYHFFLFRFTGCC
jgi:hypothetical protein